MFEEKNKIAYNCTNTIYSCVEGKMEKYKIEFNENEPKYIQISERIKNLISSNIIKDGDKLPPIRDLSKFLNVNNVTIVNCYNKLKSEGYAFQKMGAGTFAKKREVITAFNREYSKVIKNIKNLKDDNIIDFTGETTKEVNFPIDEFKKVVNKVLDRDGAEALINQEQLGYSNLRETINKIFWKGNLNVDNVLIVSGAQQGIDIASKALLNINDNVIVESPTYAGALSVFKFRRANIFELPILKDGIDLKAFEEIVKKNNIKCFYTMSYFHNPTGVSYSTEKKLKILELAKKYDFYIIEDDYLSELIYDKKLLHEPFRALDKNDRVVYIKSFSKIFLPGIRLGYIIAPSIFSESIQNSKINTDIATSTLMQRVLEMYIKEGYWIEYINNLKEEYEKRYNLMKELIFNELKDYVIANDPKGGLSFYLKLKDNKILSKDLFYKLKEKGVYITPGVVFYRKQDLGEDYFRISFSKVDEDKIIKGIKIIKEELNSWHI